MTVLRETEVLFALLRSGLTGETVSPSVQEACTEEMLEKVYYHAHRHDVAQVVGQALSKMQAPDCDVVKSFKKTAFMAFYRYGQIKYEYDRMCKTLEEGQIPFIPLKGSVIRDHYPEPWLRTSGDVDVLVREEDLDRAVELLETKLQYCSRGKAAHDVVLTGMNGFYLELHFALVQTPGKAKDILDRVWEDARPIAPGSYHHVLSSEMFYFYHLAHMAKHVRIGGSGIRNFMDLWIMSEKMPVDAEKLKKLLVRGERLDFARAADKLTRAWFCGEEPDHWTQVMEEFILSGKVYGSTENSIIIGQQVHGGGIRYVLYRIFMPYEKLKENFPVLEKHKWLTPVYQVVRWIRMLRMGRFDRSMRELSMSAKITDETRENIYALIEHLGLDFKH